MKVLLVSTVDNYGGAAKACYRLHKFLLNENINSRMLVQLKTIDSSTILGPRNDFERSMGKVRSIIDKMPVKKYKINVSFSPNIAPFSPIVKRINEINPDIVHLHWINDGLMRIEEINKIKFPIVWTMHDMWLFTGGCHHDTIFGTHNKECGKYQNKCGKCIVLNSKKDNDLSRKIFKRKFKSFSKIKDMIIVGPSKWLTECAKKSTLLKEREIITIPNPIDTELFRPFDKIKTRELFGLPLDKKLILFGAVSPISNPNKGFLQLRESLNKIKYKKDIELVIFGSESPEGKIDFGYKTHYAGYLGDDISLVALYNTCDLFVTASLQENLSNVIMENLSCGKPVVSFNIGGNSDMIEHKINGYLAKPYDTDDLATGIEWVLNNPDYEELCKNARNKVLKEFDGKIVVKRYSDIYTKILERKI